MHFDPAMLIQFATSTLPPQSQERDRGKLPDEHKWDLAPIYASDEAWRAAKEKLASALTGLREFQGKLASSPSRMADALDLQNDLDKELTRLFVYASMSSDDPDRLSFRH
jgi:oligoendopeptidase F